MKEILQNVDKREIFKTHFDSKQKKAFITENLFICKYIVKENEQDLGEIQKLNAEVEEDEEI